MAIIVPVVTTFDSKGINKAIATFKKLETTGDKFAFGLRGVDQAVGGLVKGLAKAGAAVGAVGGVIGYKLVSAAYESQKVMKQTEAIIASTGGAARISAQGVAALSEKLSEQIGVDDELIQSSANLLLTFKQVQNQTGANNDIFNQALTVAQDLGNIFGSSSGAAMQLGKALSDPVRGITALRKAGINFTEAQQAQIKALVQTGDLLGAQKIVLAEVKSQVGGVAAATATDFDRMKVAVGNVAEQFGGLLIPIVEKVSRIIIDKVVPFFKQLGDIIGERGVGAGIGFLADSFLNFTTNLDGTGEKVYWLITAMVALRTATIAYNIASSAATVVTKALGVAFNSTGFGLIVSAIAAIVVAVIAMYMKFEWFRKGINAIINFVIQMFENWVNSWINIINIFIKGINIAIKAANLFGADIEELGPIGEISFGRVGAAADKMKGKLGDAGTMMEKEGGVATVLAQKMKTLSETTGGAGGASKTAQEKFKAYADQLRAVKDATDGVASAQKAVANAQKKAVDAGLKVAEAHQRIRDSIIEVSKAEEALDRIRRGLGTEADDSKRASERVAEAQRELEDAGYGLEEAQFAVLDAEKELAEKRKDAEATTRDIREAEINLAKAKLSLANQVQSQKDATRALSDAQQEYNEIAFGAVEGSERYDEALKAVNEAKKAQEEASKNLTSAQEAEKEAIDAITEANERLVESQWKVIDAEKALAAARKEVTDQQAARAQAEEDARTRTPGRFVVPPAGGDVTIGDIMPDLLDFGAIDFLKDFNFTPFASGGVVTAPTLGLVGEAGPEAIIPLDRFSGNTTVINIEVNAGMGTDGAAVGNQIVDALRKYQRRNGAVPITVSGV